MSKPAILDSSGLLKEVLNRGNGTKQELLDTLNIHNETLGMWLDGKFIPEPFQESRLIYYCLSKHLNELLIKYEAVIPNPKSYERFKFENTPLRKIMSPFDTVLKKKPTRIGGIEVGYPIGVPASILTKDSQQIALYARKGYDILTYKTVRSRLWRAHRFPNWLFIPNSTTLSATDIDMEKPLTGDLYFHPNNPEEATAANSFGIPSSSPEKWQPDIERAKGYLKNDQVLIVSVIGTEEDNSDFDDLVRDFVKVAMLAQEAGADIVELNLSCPNLGEGHVQGELYRDPVASAKVAAAVRKEIKVPIFVKISYLAESKLAEFVHANLDFIDGIVAINTIAMPVVNAGGQPIFPPEPIARKKAGISGFAIKPLAQQVVKNLHSLRKKQGYEFDIIGIGGVATSQDVQDYLELGADGVQSCTAVLLNEDLAIETRLLTGIVPVDEPIMIMQGGSNGKDGLEKGVIAISNKERPLTTEKPEQERASELPEEVTEVSPGVYARKSSFRPLGPETIKELARGSNPEDGFEDSLWRIYEMQTKNKRPQK